VLTEVAYFPRSTITQFQDPKINVRHVVIKDLRKETQSSSSSSSSSIGTANPVRFGLLNYRWVFSAGRFL